MITLLQIFGGVALLLFGVRYLRKGLDRLFGSRITHWMAKVGSRRGFAFIAGMFAAMVAPSSTTISLLAVQAVRNEQMTFRQMLAVMLGANIGLTIMVFLIAINVQEYAPIIILAGAIPFMFTSGTRSRSIGQIILALGFIFLGISVMQQAAELGMQSGGFETDLINYEQLPEHPIMLAIAAATFAVVLQSGTAAIGLVIGLGAANVLTMDAAVPIVVGANVGMGITMLIIGWDGVDSRRLAVANLLLKLALALAAMVAVVLGIDRLPDLHEDNFGYGIAALHTGFNIAVAILGLPLLRPIARLAIGLVPEDAPQSGEVSGPKFITARRPDSVAVSLGLSLREIMHVSEIARSMLSDVWKALLEDDLELATEVSRRDDEIDDLDAAVKRFLTRLVSEETGAEEAEEQIRQLRYLAELETIGDIIDKNLCELVRKKVRSRVSFSNEGMEELQEFFQDVQRNFDIADTAFATRDRSLAEKLLRQKERLNIREVELRDAHFARLNAGLQESHETSAIHLDLLTHLKRINSALSHVAYAIVYGLQPRERDRMLHG